MPGPMPEPRILTAIITGGRPALDNRPTRQYVEPLRAAGLPDIEWVVRSDHASAYERDDLPLNVYPVDWASTYARAHWRHPTATWEPGGFFGAFPGREWAMRTGEDRGYDAVIQLDDNIITLGLLNSSLLGYRAALSTNAYMTGGQLNSVLPTGLIATIRPGYPYSVFVERTGPGRMPYYGPFEDDIMHALEYGLHGGPHRTAAVVDAIRYAKEHNSTTGMRTRYDATRGLEIARRYPANVRLGVGRRTSSPRDKTRGVRHFLSAKGFTPVAATDPDLYQDADHRLRAALAEAARLQRDQDAQKIARRAARGNP